MQAFFYIALPVLIFFCGYNLFKARFVETVLVLSMLILVLWLRKQMGRTLPPENQYKLYQNLVRWFFLIFLIYIIYAAGWKTELDRIQWFYIFPIVAFLCLGRKEGFYWAALFLVSVGVLLFYPHPTTLSPEAFLLGFKFRFLLSFTLMCVVGYAGKYGVEITYNRIVQRQEQLTESEKKYRQAYECLHQEMEARQKAQQALAESEQRYRLHFENIRDVVYSVDTDLIVRSISPSVERLLGYRPEEIIGRHIGDLNFIAPHCLRKGMSEVMRIFAGEIIDSSIYEYTAKDGAKKIGDVSGAPLFQEGKIIGLVSVAKDITERKQAEEEKQHLQERLQRAQKMEALGTLAGGVAHDLNNILSGIVSYPDLLLAQLPENSPLKKPLVVIQESGIKAAAIVQDLLTLARRAVPVSEVVDLNAVISEYLKSPEYNSLKSLYPHVHVQTALDVALFHIIGSPAHLSSAVMNLVSNATEAMPEGGDIRISTQNIRIENPMEGYEHLEPGDYVTLSISDSGIGLSIEDRERIFEPFYTKKVMGKSGTGLGMAVVWGTVKDHKGYIDIQSTEGRGTVFTLYFPASRKMFTKEKPSFSIAQYQGKGESVLVVDDVDTQREIAAAILSYLGYAVTGLSSGEAAVEYVTNHKVDLVILDMIMEPGMDGLATYEKLLEKNPRQKAVIASGFSETERVKAAQRLGAKEYIQKPYTLEKLCVAVRKTLDEN